MFQSFSLDQRILKGIEALGFSKATDVQQQTIPEALKQQDLMVCARTGSGKTAAFVVPMLQHLISRKAPNSGTRALILVPTRELAKQLLKQCQSLAKFTGIEAGMIIGGQEFKFQAALFRKNPEIIIATPGRLIDHLKQKKDLMEDVEYLILDEADRMLDMGFEEDVLTIAKACSAKTKPQTLLFSATLQQRGLKHVIKQIQDSPKEIVVDSFRGEHSNIEQHYMLADDDKHKQRILTWLLSNEEYRQAIIFTNTKDKTEQTYHFLNYHNVEVAYIHGDMTQDERNHVMTQMRNGRFKVLVATDVAARGLDIQSIDLVINLDMARSGDDYVHRIGRTGRAGASGSAISLIDHTEWNLKAAIERYLRVNMNHKYVKAIAGTYKGPKKVKGNGKAASSKSKPKNKKEGKKGPQSKARPTKGKRDNSNKKKPTSKRTIWGDGTAPFKPKKKPEA